MRLKEEIAIDVEKTFGETKFVGYFNDKFDKEDKTKLDARRYNLKSKVQERVITVLLEADAGEKNFKYNEVVKLVGVRVEVIPNAIGRNNAEINWVVYADDMVPVNKQMNTPENEKQKVTTK